MLRRRSSRSKSLCGASVRQSGEDCHLHEFRIGNERFGQPDPMDVLSGGPPTRSERTTRLFSVLGRKGAKAVYTYDFGDDWEHNISVEKVLAPEPGLAYPACTGGNRHGPPEDCGGAYGYHNLLEILGDPNHDDPEEMREWVGEDFDPEAFSVDDINQSLAHFQHRQKSRWCRAVNQRGRGFDRTGTRGSDRLR